MNKLALAVLSALLILMAAYRGVESDIAVLADVPTTVPAFTESTALLFDLGEAVLVQADYMNEEHPRYPHLLGRDDRSATCRG